MNLRLQLTLLYAVPFLLSGLALLTIPLLGASQSEPAGVGPPAVEEPSSSGLPPITALGFAVMVVLSFVLGWWIAGRFLRPLRTITATARDISATNLHRRLALTGHDNEFTDLGNTLDDLFSRLETSFESQRRFVANASHELRTPLTAERALIQVALADSSADVASFRATCAELLALSQAQERLIDSLLTLATSERGIDKPVPFDLASVARSVVESRSPSISASLSPVKVMGSPQLATSLVANLVDNALRYNVPGGSVEVITTGSRLIVRNTGPVVPQDQIALLFQPFQRLGAQRVNHADGHGLGLAIVRAIALAHGATVTTVAPASGGLEIEVDFP